MIPSHYVFGWVIVHPDGSIETDYFQSRKWNAKGKRVSRATWMKTYRADCQMVCGELLFETTRAPKKGKGK